MVEQYTPGSGTLKAAWVTLAGGGGGGGGKGAIPKESAWIQTAVRVQLATLIPSLLAALRWSLSDQGFVCREASAEKGLQSGSRMGESKNETICVLFYKNDTTWGEISQRKWYINRT